MSIENESFDTDPEHLRLRLEEQTRLNGMFDEARVGEFYKEDITLGQRYRDVTSFRYNKQFFIIKHNPTGIIKSWSVNTGPRALKRLIEEWVDSVEDDLQLE